MKFVDISKRSKKEQKAYYASQRNMSGFNTGTRTMKTVKNPTRAMQKDAWRKGKEMQTMSKTIQDAYRIVFNDILNQGPNFFCGEYDAENGKADYMHGIGTVMEYLAYKVSDEDGYAFEDLFIKNMVASEQKAKCKRCAELPGCFAGQNGCAKIGCECFSPRG